MSFHIDTHDMPQIRDYQSAYEHWAKAQPWPNQHDEHDGRPLGGRNRKNKVIRKLNDGSIALRLHNTDVVIYHPDHRITLNAFQSISTDLFANRLLPTSVGVSFNNDHGFYIGLTHTNAPHLEGYHFWTNARWARMRSSTITLKRMDDEINYCVASEDQLEPLVQFRIDRRKANLVAKASGLKEFTTWYKAYVAMLPAASRREPSEKIYPVEITDLLTIYGVPGWMRLANSQYAVGASESQFLNFLKQQVYSRNHQIFNATVYNTFTWRTLTNTLRTNARYGMEG